MIAYYHSLCEHYLTLACLLEEAGNLEAASHFLATALRYEREANYVYPVRIFSPYEEGIEVFTSKMYWALLDGDHENNVSVANEFTREKGPECALLRKQPAPISVKEREAIAQRPGIAACLERAMQYRKLSK